MKLKVIYLDDEVDLCEIFSDEFASEDVDVQTFCEPQKAIDAVKQDPPDLIFLDYRLPGTTGDKVAQMMNNSIAKYLISGDLEVETTYPFEIKFQKPWDSIAIHELIKKSIK